MMQHAYTQLGTSFHMGCCFLLLKREIANLINLFIKEIKLTYPHETTPTTSPLIVKGEPESPLPEKCHKLLENILK